MLVLSRKVNQEIIIAANIRIHILKTNGNTVRIGIEAPPNVRIVRGELLEEPQPVGEPDLEPGNSPASVTVISTDPRKTGGVDCSVDDLKSTEESFDHDLLPLKKHADCTPGQNRVIQIMNAMKKG